jgi:hypothetical protein
MAKKTQAEIDAERSQLEQDEADAAAPQGDPLVRDDPSFPSRSGERPYAETADPGDLSRGPAYTYRQPGDVEDGVIQEPLVVRRERDAREFARSQLDANGQPIVGAGSEKVVAEHDRVRQINAALDRIVGHPAEVSLVRRLVR